MDEEIHQLIRPSSAERAANCPASVFEEYGLPNVETPDATEGTRLHARIAEEIEKWKQTGIAPDLDGEPEVEAMFNYFLLVFNGMKRNEGATRNDVFTEYPVNYSACGTELYHGTADVVIICKNEVAAIDWKTGHVRVTEVENNLQFQFYAAALMQMCGKESCELHVFNPSIGQRDFALFLKGEIRLRKIFFRAINHPEHNTGEWCRYCRANQHGTCRAIHERASRALKIALSDGAPMFSELPAHELTAQYEELQHAVDYRDKLRAEITRRAEADGNCGDYFIRLVSSGVTVDDIPALYERISGVVSEDEFMAQCTISESKIRKIYAQNMKKIGHAKTQKDAEMLFAELSADLVTPKAPRKVLAKIGAEE